MKLDYSTLLVLALGAPLVSARLRGGDSSAVQDPWPTDATSSQQQQPQQDESVGDPWPITSDNEQQALKKILGPFDDKQDEAGNDPWPSEQHEDEQGVNDPWPTKGQDEQQAVNDPWPADTDKIDQKKKDYDLRWASCGGGWRSMVTEMGFANAFKKVGLIDDASTAFSAVSTTSGASWFSTQFFYSDQFHQQTLSPPKDLNLFVMRWMQSYVEMQKRAPQNEDCALLGDLAELVPLGDVNVTEMCNILAAYDGDWAAFTTDMLHEASTDYGDAKFIDKQARPDNRVKSMADTDLYVQMSLAPNSRVQTAGSPQPQMSYLSPQGSVQVYTTSLASIYAIKDDAAKFRVAVEDTYFPLSTVTGPAPGNFDMNEFESFHLDPNEPGKLLTHVSDDALANRQFFEMPFANGATVAQIAAASSAAVGSISGDVPTMLAHQVGSLLYRIEQSTELGDLEKLALQGLLPSVADEIYLTPLVDDLAVCTEWPQKCGTDNGRLTDGADSDGPSMALNIGQYQRDHKDRSKTLKMIFTNTNYYTDSNMKFLAYFETDFNKGVAPGDFVWARTLGDNGRAENTPVRSPQIFSEKLSEEAIAAASHPIHGTNFTYATIDATTIANRAFGTVKGQKVEILMLSTNSHIPTVLVGTALTEKYIEPLADLAESLASNEQIHQVIQNFLNE